MCCSRLYGQSIRNIAQRFGVSKSTVHRIVRDVEPLPKPEKYRCEMILQADGTHRFRMAPVGD